MPMHGAGLWGSGGCATINLEPVRARAVAGDSKSTPLGFMPGACFLFAGRDTDCTDVQVNCTSDHSPKVEYGLRADGELVTTCKRLRRAGRGRETYGWRAICQRMSTLYEILVKNVHDC